MHIQKHNPKTYDSYTKFAVCGLRPLPNLLLFWGNVMIGMNRFCKSCFFLSNPKVLIDAYYYFLYHLATAYKQFLVAIHHVFARTPFMRRLLLGCTVRLFQDYLQYDRVLAGFRLLTGSIDV